MPYFKASELKSASSYWDRDGFCGQCNYDTTALHLSVLEPTREGGGGGFWRTRCTIALGIVHFVGPYIYGDVCLT